MIPSLAHIRKQVRCFLSSATCRIAMQTYLSSIGIRDVSQYGEIGRMMSTVISATDCSNWAYEYEARLRNKEGVHYDCQNTCLCVERDIRALIIAFRVPISMLKSLSAKSTSIEGSRT